MGVDAMVFVRTERVFTDAEIRRLAYEAGRAFGSDKFFRYDDRHNISRVKDDREEDAALSVNVATRYYGPGYERGDLPFLVILAEWLERKIPGCVVLYGGDSDDTLEPFDAKARSGLLDHFAGPESRAYFNYGWGAGTPKSPTCPLCAESMPQYGCGPGRAAGSFCCGGCGNRLRTIDGGTTFTEIKEEGQP